VRERVGGILQVRNGVWVVLLCVGREVGVSIESGLEGVNRRNLKIVNFKHNYKPGLALEIKQSPKERAKTNHKQIARVTR
jgi:hypothetical protein